MQSEEMDCNLAGVFCRVDMADGGARLAGVSVIRTLLRKSSRLQVLLAGHDDNDFEMVARFSSFF